MRCSSRGYNYRNEVDRVGSSASLLRRRRRLGLCAANTMRLPRCLQRREPGDGWCVSRLLPGRWQHHSVGASTCLLGGLQRGNNSSNNSSNGAYRVQGRGLQCPRGLPWLIGGLLRAALATTAAALAAVALALAAAAVALATTAVALATTAVAVAAAALAVAAAALALAAATLALAAATLALAAAAVALAAVALAVAAVSRLSSHSAAGGHAADGDDPCGLCLISRLLVRVAEAESMATVDSAARNLCAAATYTPQPRIRETALCVRYVTGNTTLSAA